MLRRAMTALRKPTMFADEFLAWAERQPGRWELLEGVPTAMAPERVVHGDTKYRVARSLDAAIAKARVACRFVLDGAAVRIDAKSLYQPTRSSIAANRSPATRLKFPIPSSSSRCCRPATP
jgi:hypothetical protein